MAFAALAILENNWQQNELARFYSKNKRRFYAIAYAKLNNKQDAEDAVMDAISRIADKPEKFFQIKEEKRVSYVNIIVRNAAIDLYRKQHKKETAELSDDLTEDISGNMLEDRIISNVSKEDLTNFIASLPPLQRDTLQLKVYYGLTNAEIAQQLAVSESTVRQRLFRARKAIGNFLEKEDSENE